MAPSHVDLSVLWVPIMPETSKLGEQMEEVGKEATESFGKGSTGLGDKIHESVSKSRDKIKDVFHRTGSDAGKSMSDAFKEESKAVEDTVGDVGEKAKGKFRESAKGWGQVLVEAVGPETKKLLGDRVEDVVGGAFKSVLGDNAKLAGQFARTVADSGFDELKKKLGGVKDAANDTKSAFADFGKGDTVGGVSKLVDGFGKLGLEVKDLPQPLQDVAGKISDGKNTALEFAGVFKDLPGKIGLVGTAIGELAGPLGIVIGLASELYREAQQSEAAIAAAFHDPAMRAAMEHHEAEQHPLNLNAAPNAPLPPMDMVQKTALAQLAGSGDQEALSVLQKRAAGGDQEAVNLLRDNNLQTAIKPDPVSTAPPGSWFGGGGHKVPMFTPHNSGTTPSTDAPPPSSGSSSGGTSNLPSSFVGGASSSYSSPSDLHAGGSRVANLYAVARSLEGTPYSQALRNDCSGMVSKLATAALGMPPSVQFSTVNEGDWLMSHGFKPGVGPAGSLQVGWYDHGGGNMGHTAATLPGGEHAESGGAHGNFLVGSGAAGANDPQFTQHAWLPMDGSGGGTKSPLGSQEDPLFVSAAEKGSSGGSAGAAGGDSSPLAQQLGSGLLGGIAQSVGLDGSVFKTFSGASNPMDFGITKLGTGLLNWAGGMLPAMQGQHGPKQQQPASPTYNVDQSFNLTQHGVQGDGSDQFKAGMNSSNRTAALAAPMPG